MGADLVSVVFTLLAGAAAWFVAPKEDSYKAKVVVGWTVAAAIGFFINMPAAAFLLLGIAYSVLAAGPPKIRVYTFLAVFSSLPVYFSYNVPFPGLNYLLELDSARISVIAILLPAFAVLLSRKVEKGFRSADIVLILLVLLIGALSLRALPATSALRAMIYAVFAFYVPYFCITRALDTPQAIDSAIKVLFVTFCVVAFIGVITTVTHWNYYSGTGAFSLSKIHWDTRNGFLRIYATMTPALTGYLMACAFSVVFYLRSIGAVKSLYVYPLALLFGFICFATGSRAGLMALILIAAVYWMMSRSTPSQRKMFVAVSSVCVIALVLGIMSGNVTVDDEYGTFEYRARLMTTGLQETGKRPFFGDANVLERPAFQALVQGENIVDLVNSYLMIALLYGLIGLYFYFAAFFIAMRRLLQAMTFIDLRSGKKKADDPDDKRLKGQLALLFAMLAGLLFLLGTTSSTSYMFNYGFAFMAIGLTAGVVAKKAEPLPQPAPSSAEPPPDAEPGADTANTPPARVPYGARFVRRF